MTDWTIFNVGKFISQWSSSSSNSNRSMFRIHMVLAKAEQSFMWCIWYVHCTLWNERKAQQCARFHGKTYEKHVYAKHSPYLMIGFYWHTAQHCRKKGKCLVTVVAHRNSKRIQLLLYSMYMHIYTVQSRIWKSSV